MPQTEPQTNSEVQILDVVLKERPSLTRNCHVMDCLPEAGRGS